MAHQEAQVLTASAADIAADMDHHRQTYGGFLSLMKWVSIVSAVILVVVFFVLY